MTVPEASFYPVLHIDTGRTWGGGQQQVLLLHRGLLQRGVLSILVCPKGSPLARKVAAESIPVVEINMRHPLRLMTAARIARVARLNRAGTIHMHTSLAHSLGLLAARLLKGDVHKVVSRRVAFAQKPSLFTRRKYVGRGIRYIAISQAVKETLLRLGVPGGDVSVVHSGIDVDRFTRFDPQKAKEIRRELGIAPGSFIVGSIGSLVPCKGHAVLIGAMAEVVKSVSSAACLVVGEGPERARLESLVRRSGLQGKVVLAGDREEVPELLSLMDIFVMPSLQEGLGSALLEAMAAGKAVIASDVGGIPEVIADCQTGILVPPGQPDSLKKAIVALFREPARISILGSNARRHVRERFSWESMVEGTIRIYRSLT